MIWRGGVGGNAGWEPLEVTPRCGIGAPHPWLRDWMEHSHAMRMKEWHEALGGTVHDGQESWAEHEARTAFISNSLSVMVAFCLGMNRLARCNLTFQRRLRLFTPAGKQGGKG